MGYVPRELDLIKLNLRTISDINVCLTVVLG